MWQLASKKALRKTEDERRPSWAQRFKNIEPMNALRLRYNANKSIWVEDDIQIKIEVGFEMDNEKTSLDAVRPPSFSVRFSSRTAVLILRCLMRNEAHD